MTTGGTNMTSGRVELLTPDGLVKSPAFSHVAVVSGPVRTIYIGGQDAVTADGENVGKGDLAAQTTQILTNVKSALAAAGAGPEHVIKWNLLLLEGQSIQDGIRGVPAGLAQAVHASALDHRGLRQRPRPPRLAGRDGRDRGRTGLTVAVRAASGR